MELLQQMIGAVEHYPAEYVKLEIIDYPLIKVKLQNWVASLDGLLKSRSNGGENPSAVYAAEVVGL